MSPVQMDTVPLKPIMQRLDTISIHLTHYAFLCPKRISLLATEVCSLQLASYLVQPDCQACKPLSHRNPDQVHFWNFFFLSFSPLRNLATNFIFMYIAGNDKAL